MTLLDQIQAELQDRLNKNSKGVVFVLGQFIQQSDIDFKFKSNPTSTVSYTTEYVPCMLNNVNTPKSVKDLDIYEFNFTLTCALLGENESKEPQLSQRIALDEFRQYYNTRELSFDVEGETYNAITISFQITLQSLTNTLSGEKRTFVALNVGMQVGKGIYFGNAITTSLAPIETPTVFTEIKKVASVHTANKISSDGNPLNDTISYSVATDKNYLYNTTIFYENNALVNAMMTEILSKGTINKKYLLRNVFTPLGTITDKTVIIKGGVVNDNVGEILTLSFDITDTIA